MKQIFDS